MKLTKSHLKTMIRSIVKEEVAMSIGDVIREIKEPVENTEVSLNEEKVVNEKQYFTSNSVLNEVLNETVNNEEWKTMGGGVYDSSKANEVMASQYGDVLNGNGKVNPDAMVASMGVDPNQVDDSVKDIFTKDYRSFMKKVNEKRG